MEKKSKLAFDGTQKVTRLASTKINNGNNQNDWYQSHLLTTAVMQFVDCNVVTNSPNLVTSMLNSNELYKMAVVAPEVRMNSAKELLGYLYKRGVQFIGI